MDRRAQARDTGRTVHHATRKDGALSSTEGEAPVLPDSADEGQPTSVVEDDIEDIDIDIDIVEAPGRE